MVYVPVEEDDVIPPQEKCLCGGRSWRFMLKTSIKKDYQTILVQDPAEDNTGAKSQTLTVKLFDELTGKVQPGNIIVINGIYRGQQKKQSATLETYLDAKSVEITNKDFTKIESAILAKTPLDSIKGANRVTLSEKMKSLMTYAKTSRFFFRWR